MAMEINGLNSNQANAGKAKSGQKTSAVDTGARKSPPSADGSRGETETVKISAEAQALNRASQQLETEAPVNQEKVDALRAAIADGSYKADPQSIARKMLESDSLF